MAPTKTPAPTPAPTPIGSATPAPTPIPAANVGDAPTPIPATNAGDGSAAPAPTPVPAAASAPAKLAIVINDNIPIPTKKTGGRGGQMLYPFDKLEIGQSFGVPGKSNKGMASTVSSANKRYLDEVKDAEGKVVTDAKGKPVTRPSRKFVSGAVDPTTDPVGASVRVWRVAIDTPAPSA